MITHKRLPYEESKMRLCAALQDVIDFHNTETVALPKRFAPYVQDLQADGMFKHITFIFDEGLGIRAK